MKVTTRGGLDLDVEASGPGRVRMRGRRSGSSTDGLGTSEGAAGRGRSAGEAVPVSTPASAVTASRRWKVTFTVMGTPKGKPRMTRSDTWTSRTPRPCVQAWWDWADKIRKAAEKVDWPEQLQGRLLIHAYLPFSSAFGVIARRELAGTPHRVDPDEDNISKGIKDALFEEDNFIWNSHCIKLWDDGKGPRVEIALA